MDRLKRPMSPQLAKKPWPLGGAKTYPRLFRSSITYRTTCRESLEKDRHRFFFWNLSKSLRLPLEVCFDIAVNKVVMVVGVEQDRIPSSCDKCSLHMPSGRLSCCFGSTSRGCMGRLLRHIIMILRIKRILIHF
jgi:hypothetical protein